MNMTDREIRLNITSVYAKYSEIFGCICPLFIVLHDVYEIN